MTRYAIRHLTRFTYDTEASESVMELRLQPASDGRQQCLQFELQVQPRARVFAYVDALGNWVHHFDLPGKHRQLSITSRAFVQVDTAPALPNALPPDSWQAVDSWVERGDDWDFRQPSRFAEWSEALLAFADSLGPLGQRDRDPLTTVTRAMAAIYERFEYAPRTTRVDSPIDEALAARRGVCQDFTHVLLAVLRRLRLPCRYVSGYIAPAPGDRSGSTSVATHAWVEVRLPEVGWIGVDPTNNIHAAERHIRVAIGRDYADVPPTRGVFKGGAASTLAVSVAVAPGSALPAPEPEGVEAAWVAVAPELVREGRQQQEQQQQ
jgi:transglutaminase-like putative cysteine protease